MCCIIYTHNWLLEFHLITFRTNNVHGTYDFVSIIIDLEVFMLTCTFVFNWISFFASMTEWDLIASLYAKNGRETWKGMLSSWSCRLIEIASLLKFHFLTFLWNDNDGFVTFTLRNIEEQVLGDWFEVNGIILIK